MNKDTKRYPSTMREKDEGPFPPNIAYSPKAKSTGMKYRCTSCGNNYPESKFAQTAIGDFCSPCVEVGLHQHESPSVTIDVIDKPIIE